MGLLNSKQGIYVASNILRKNACVICHKPPINQIFDEATRKTFDYICAYCNAEIHISELAFGDISLLEHDSEARRRIKDEIRSVQGKPFDVTEHVLQYFLGKTKHKTVTFEDWSSGLVIGDVTDWSVSDRDLDLIKIEQKKLLEELVSEKFRDHKKSFEKRKERSINPKQMLLNEIDDVQNIIEKGRYKFESKPTPNESLKIGAYRFDTYSVLKCVQDMYEAALDGSIDLDTVPSRNQTIGVGASRVRLDCMAQAIAYGQLFEYLKSLAELKTQSTPDLDNILNNSSFGDGTVINVGSTVNNASHESGRSNNKKEGDEPESQPWYKKIEVIIGIVLGVFTILTYLGFKTERFASWFDTGEPPLIDLCNDQYGFAYSGAKSFDDGIIRPQFLLTICNGRGVAKNVKIRYNLFVEWVEIHGKIQTRRILPVTVQDSTQLLIEYDKLREGESMKRWIQTLSIKNMDSRITIKSYFVASLGSVSDEKDEYHKIFTVHKFVEDSVQLMRFSEVKIGERDSVRIYNDLNLYKF